MECQLVDVVNQLIIVLMLRGYLRWRIRFPLTSKAGAISMAITCLVSTNCTIGVKAIAHSLLANDENP